MNRIRRALTENRAETGPTSPDGRLRGRTYAIPFELVWRAATHLTEGGLKGWTTRRADDQAGVIEALSRPLLFGPATDVRVEIGLDENGQTRVDASSASRTERGDLGRCIRVIGTFFRRLDDQLDAQPGQILDATRVPVWPEPK